MRATASAAGFIVAALLLLRPGEVCAQEQAYTMAVRGIELDEALRRFVDATGTAVSYDPALVRGRTVSCTAENDPAEEVLRCLLADSGLDFYRLSSGTYVLTERVQIAPERGFVAGRVVDWHTGSPVSNSHVLLADAGLMTVTDRAGRFTFPALLPGRYVLSISHLGYRPWRDTLVVAAHEQVHTEAVLRTEPIIITPVVIDGFQHRPASGGLGRPTATSKDLEPLTDPGRGLHTLSGIRLNSVTADIHVQGSEAGATQFRLDGAPVFLPRNIAGLVGAFGSFALERITVHKSGFGASEGSQVGGLVLAEHALSNVDDFDVQVDPYSLNTRLRLAPGEDLAVMAAARVGLWDVHAPTRLQTTLDQWSRPDPFLVYAPLESGQSFTLPTDPSPLLGSPVDPQIRFSDLHAAARLRFGPLRSLHASFYEGRQRLGGGVFSHSRAEPDSPVTGTAFTVVDDYDWRNRSGQIRYDAVLGSRTLAGIQLRASGYDLRHDYRTLDSLHLVLEDQTPRLSSVSTTPIRNGNAVSTFAVEGTVDYARGVHHMTAGGESGLVTSRFDLQSVYFASKFLDDESNLGGGRPSSDFDQRSVSSRTDTWYAATYAEDRIRITSNLRAEAGIRLTYLSGRNTVYAEPRLAALYDRGDGVLGPWSSRTSAGVYRQFLNQADASTLNAGALLPAVRVWLPVDASVRPPMAYHLAQELLFTPSSNWRIRLEGYVRFHSHGLALAYAPVNSPAHLEGAVRQSQFLVDTRGRAVGASASLSRQTSTLRVEARYARAGETRRGDVLFGGRSHPVPWNEPHRLELVADWMPAGPFSLTARWQGVWGRAWGFRQLYYDYFGHSESTRLHPPADLGDPASHVLPPLYQLDVSLAVTQPIGRALLQLRAEALNVLDRQNVIDWRLIPDGGWKKEARTLYPMMPAFAARLTL